MIAIGGTDTLTLVSAAGQVVGSIDLPGLERIAGSGVELAWVRARKTVWWSAPGTWPRVGRSGGYDLPRTAQRH